MHPSNDFTRIVDRKRYSTSTAELIASDEYWDGHNFERNGRNQFLYRTPKGAYFIVTLSQWQGEQDTLEPVDLQTAIEAYETHLTEHEVPYTESFPTVKVEDA